MKKTRFSSEEEVNSKHGHRRHRIPLHELFILLNRARDGIVIGHRIGRCQPGMAVRRTSPPPLVHELRAPRALSQVVQRAGAVDRVGCIGRIAFAVPNSGVECERALEPDVGGDIAARARLNHMVPGEGVE